MTDFFAAVYEWFGLIPNDLADQLRGWDYLCEAYTGTPWYVYVGWLMLLVTGLVYVLQYHIIDWSGFSRKHHWWLMALAAVVVNFAVAFSIPYTALQAGDHCVDLNWSIPDCAGYGLTNGLLSFLVFVGITSTTFPRRFSTNCSHTTFWQP